MVFLKPRGKVQPQVGCWIYQHLLLRKDAVTFCSVTALVLLPAGAQIGLGVRRGWQAGPAQGRPALTDKDGSMAELQIDGCCQLLACLASPGREADSMPSPFKGFCLGI